MKVLDTASLFLLLVTARCTFGQFKIHHTTYGAPFGVPSHGSTNYLSPFGANSLSSVLTALGIGPSSPNSQLTLTPSTSASGNNAAVPTFVISNASNRNQRPSEQTFEKVTNSKNPALNGQTVLRTSPVESAGGGPQQIPAESIVSNQITPNPIGAAASDTLASRFVPPPPPNTNTLNTVQETQSNAALESQSTNLLNSLFNSLLSPNPSTPFSSLSSQTPFIVILPQGESGSHGVSQSAQVIMNVDPTRNLQNNSPQSAASSDIRAQDVISDVAQFMQANGLSTDLTRGAGSQHTGTPRIITVTPQVANQGLSSFPQETPVLVLLDPATLQGPSRSGTSALSRSSTTGVNALGNEASRISNQNFLNALTALAQPFPVTQSTTSIPTAISHSSNAPGTSESGTTLVNGLPPFPGQDHAVAITNVNTPGNVIPSSARASSTSTSGTAPNASQDVAGSSGSTIGSTPRKTTQMIIPVIQDIRSLSRGAGGVYMYSFSIAGSDGITRHEVGEVAPGIRKISRTVSPAGIGSRSGAGVQGAFARKGSVNGATPANVVANTGAAGANGLVDASNASVLADAFNVFGNYSYVDPNGQVFKLHYTNGPPNFVHHPPPEPLPPAAPHPFDFLLNKLTDLRVHHQLESGLGATGTGAAGPGATGTGATGPGATGTGATGPGATGTGATGPGATGNVSTDFGTTRIGTTGTGATEPGATGTGVAGSGVTGNGATRTGASIHGTTGNEGTGTAAAGKSTTTAENPEPGSSGDILAEGVVNGSGSTAANEVAANEVGAGAAGSSGTGGTNKSLKDGPAAAVSEGAATGADQTAAEAVPNAA